MPAMASNPIDEAQIRLMQAIENPEYMLDHWIDLPTSPDSLSNKTHQMTLREAILLALRYNPNIQNAELDRIIQRYQLRLAHNAFELQFALSGEGVIGKTKFNGVGSETTRSFIGAPVLSYKNPLGTQASVNISNNVDDFNNYNPLLNLSITQPLLRGFGRDVNEAALRNAIDNEWLNKLRLKQSVIDQVTTVINAYRSLILSGNNLKNQRLQLKEAQKSYDINEKKIEAGILEPTANVQQSYQIESLNLLVEQAENDFKVAAQNLLQAIGLDPRMRIAVPDDVQVKKVYVPDMKQSIEIAMVHNAEYQALKMAYRADQRAYTVAKNEQMWQLDVGANLQTGQTSQIEGQAGGIQGIYNGQNVNQSARITLTIPVRDLNRRNQLIAAKVQLEKDRLNLLAAKRALETNITNTINTIESLAKRYQLAVKQVQLAEKSYMLEKKKQQAGISSALDVSNTQNQLIQAQAGLIGAKIAYLNQISALERMLGTTLESWKIQLRFGR